VNRPLSILPRLSARPTVPAPPASYPAALAAAQARLDESDFAEDWDDPEHLTPVFPPDFVAPCERCGGSSLGDRYCPSCELELEGWES